jgi:hypothetical protein
VVGDPGCSESTYVQQIDADGQKNDFQKSWHLYNLTLDVDRLHIGKYITVGFKARKQQMGAVEGLL